jgi:ubiquinone/menaquinone biosynthesis C-methylase UbiE
MKSMSHSMSSYEFDAFQEIEKAKEIARLKSKASILFQIDQKNWQQAELRSGMKILDLGCGSGTVSCELAKSIRTGEVIGVDSSEAILQQAQQLKDSEGIDNITFRQGNAYALNFPDKTFDFVYSRFLFQHLADPLKVLSQVHRILKPGGILCVLDVDENWFTLYPEPASFTLLRQILVPIQQSQGGDPFVGRKLGNYFDAAGFDQVQTLIHAISSDALGLNHFFELLSFGAPYQTQREDLAEMATKAREDVYSLLSLPYAWAGIGLLTAIGRKSSSLEV